MVAGAVGCVLGITTVEALFFLESQNGTYGQGVQAARREEEKEAERLYQEAGE